MDIDEVKRIRDEQGVGLTQAKTIYRHQQRLARLEEMERHATGVLRSLLRLMIEEERGV